ncbi:MAG TPA: hypothetical protein VEI06_12720 [Gemmatimonadaceae bacterium]|nr:hypothetical protein [Gemmatimonadaceae bacterium]
MSYCSLTVHSFRVRRLLVAISALSASAFVAPAQTTSPSSGQRPSALAGEYVLTRAGTVKPPANFVIPLAGMGASGTIDSARVVLAADGSYTSQLVVRWRDVPLIPVPGIGKAGERDVLNGQGHWTASHGTIVIEPSDLLSRTLIKSLTARAVGSRSILLISASGGLAGDTIPMSAEFVRVR